MSSATAQARRSSCCSTTGRAIGSQGRFHWWPTTADAQVPLSARELIILLWNGDPERAQMAQDWRRVA